MMNKLKIYPRSKDRETVYLKNVVTDPGIIVGDYTIVGADAERRLRKMTEPIHKGKDLPPVWVIHAASGGDSEAMEQVLRYYDDYMSRLCTRTLYDKDGTPHVCVDTHMKRCLEIRLIRAVMRA
mgnify:CR=1 FL=1